MQPSTSGHTRLAWVCSQCERECFIIRSESRCLCGHRYKDHDDRTSYICKTARCACRRFFYIVAEGAWILRCRCKHKHTDHDPATHACCKSGCSCSAFDSPWVCNCNHGWADHQQQEVAAVPLSSDAGLMQAVSDVNRWDLLQRGQEGAAGSSKDHGRGRVLDSMLNS